MYCNSLANFGSVNEDESYRVLSTIKPRKLNENANNINCNVLVRVGQYLFSVLKILGKVDCFLHERFSW